VQTVILSEWKMGHRRTAQTLFALWVATAIVLNQDIAPESRIAGCESSSDSAWLDYGVRPSQNFCALDKKKSM
jgi:hypothetical protein